ncbi:salviol synthase-like isoform X3 [Andrographis paniculata]|uniref:salviol synthase-like isoform X3 n=1 Tax=Andrographis paniculata TaxID=175694 RepID=UPI0021E87515|nr:salviol synthase-like isoform X3 [Andrographis paniculata]
MATDFSSWIILFSSFIFLATLWNLITQSKRRRSSANLPPGPIKLPVIGNLHNLISFRPPHRVLADLASKHGPMMHLQLGQISTVVVSSPNVAKEFLKTHDITFANRPSFFATEIICYGHSDIAFAPYGEYWRQLRKICTVELLSARRVQSFRPIREEDFSNLCRWIASKERSSVNLTEKIAMSTCDTVMRACLGNKTDEHAQFISIVKESAELAAGFYIVDLYPSMAWFGKINGFKGRVEKVHKRADRILGKILDDHKVAASRKKEREDLADVLLKYHKDSGHELQLTDDNIKAVLQDMFDAGIETSSATADWVMAELLRHPRVLKKAQDEVRQVFGDKGFVDESEFDELKYLKLVIKETLRMHPPLPLLLPRESYEACEINGYKLPAKTRVMVNAWAIGRDPKIWKDADSFIPERFLDGISVDYTGKNFNYIPFGSGRRICPGMTFGLANIEHPLAMFLYHFDWVLPDGMKPEDLDMAETIGVTSRRNHPLYVIPKMKNPLPLK